MEDANFVFDLRELNRVLEKVGLCLVELAVNDQGLFHARFVDIFTLIEALTVVIQNKIGWPQVFYGFL